MDGTFSFYDDLNINTYWARTATAGVEDELSYRAQLDYAGRPLRGATGAAGRGARRADRIFMR